VEVNGPPRKWVSKPLRVKIAFRRLNIDHAELLPVGPATVVPDNIGFKRAQ